jgi:hypothetical protein
MLTLYENLWSKISSFLTDVDFMAYHRVHRQLNQCFQSHQYEWKQKFYWSRHNYNTHPSRSCVKITRIYTQGNLPNITGVFRHWKHEITPHSAWPVLPETLHSLEIIINDDMPPEAKFPAQLQVLIIHAENGIDYFPTSMRGLPASLHTLKLRDFCVTSPLNFLPAGLQVLDIDTNQSLNGLPPDLKSLCVKGKLHQEFNQLPKTLKTLHIEGEYQHSLALLPPGLLELLIDDDEFNQPLTHLPLGLHTLKLWCNALVQDLDHLPPHLLTLLLNSTWFNNSVNNLPSRLHTLCIGSSRFNQPLDHLPPQLHTLKLFCDQFNQPVGCLPARLNWLCIDGCAFNQPLTQLPPQLETLYISTNNYNLDLLNLPHTVSSLFLFCQTHQGSLQTQFAQGDNIRNLHLSYNLIETIKSLPQNVVKLIINDKFHTCSNFLPSLRNPPPSLRYLYWIKHPSMNLSDWPPSLTHLVLGNPINIAHFTWPLYLQQLKLHDLTITIEV